MVAKQQGNHFAARFTSSCIIAALAVLAAIVLVTLWQPTSAWAANNGPKYNGVEDDEASIWFIYSDNQGYQVFDAYETYEESKYAGATYDQDTNTLTLNKVDNDFNLVIDRMGEGFKIKVIGSNTIGQLELNGYEWGAGVEITGTGSLVVNAKKTYSPAIKINAGEYDNEISYTSKGCLHVGKDVTFKAFAGSSGTVLSITGSSADKIADAVKLDGTMSPALTASNTYTSGGKYDSIPSFTGRYLVGDLQQYDIAAKTSTGKYFAVKKVEETATAETVTYDIYEVIDFDDSQGRKGALLSSTKTEAQFASLTNYQAVAAGTVESYMPVNKREETNNSGVTKEYPSYVYACTKDGETYYAYVGTPYGPLTDAWSKMDYVFYRAVGPAVTLNGDRVDFTYLVPTGDKVTAPSSAATIEFYSLMKSAMAKAGYTATTYTADDPFYCLVTAAQLTNTPPIDPAIAHTTVTLSKTSMAYTGKALKPAVTVKTAKGTTLVNGTDYVVSYSNNTKVGTATVKVTGKGKYTGAKSVSFKITKAAQKLTVKAKSPAAKAGKTIKIAKAITIKNAKGTITYKKVSGHKKITVNAKTGKISIKKGLAKGTYKVKIKVTAKGNASFKAKSKTITVKVKVK